MNCDQATGEKEGRAAFAFTQIEERAAKGIGIEHFAVGPGLFGRDREQIAKSSLARLGEERFGVVDAPVFFVASAGP